MKALIAILMLAIAAQAPGQASISWLQNTPGASIALDNSNSVFTIRSINIPGGDIYLTKRNPDGLQIWERFYDQTDPLKFEKAVCVVTDASGNAIVTGNLTSSSATTTLPQGVVMKYDPNGNLLWRVVYTSSAELMQITKCLCDDEGNIYLLGSSPGNSAVASAKVRKLSPAGATIWNYSNTAVLGSPVNFKLADDNCILVSTRSGNTGPNSFAKVSFAGIEIWNYRVQNTSAAGDIAGDASGNSYLINRETISAIPGSTLRKLTPAGTLLWQRTAGIYAGLVESGSDGMPVIAGSSMANTAGTSLVKFDASGNQLWLLQDADGSINIVQQVELLIDAQNNPLLAGNTAGNMGVCKANANGSFAWSIAVPSPVAVVIQTSGIELGTDNCVYITGGVTAKIRQTAACPLPQNLSSSDITATSAKLNWGLVAGAVRYEVQYRSMIAPSVNRLWERVLVPGDVNFAVISGLKCNTYYQWRMRAVCDTLAPALNTGFTALQTFRTSACVNVSDKLQNSSDGVVEDRSDEAQNLTPESNFLNDNFPNPFNPSTGIGYSVAEDGFVKLEVFNTLGQRVSLLVNEFRQKGSYKVTWHGTDDNGSALPGGIYFYKLTAGDFVSVKKMVLSK